MCEEPLPGQTKDYIDRYLATHVPLRILSGCMFLALLCCVETTVEHSICRADATDAAAGSPALQCVAGSCQTLHTAFFHHGIDQLLQLNKSLNTPFRWSTLRPN